MYHFRWDAEADEYCCGVFTAGQFRYDDADPEEEDVDGYHKTIPAAAKAAILEMIEEAGQRPIMMWFVRRCDYSKRIHEDAQYECDGLRRQVARTKGVVKLGTFINPGTKNQIDGYMLTGHCTKGVKIQ